MPLVFFMDTFEIWSALDKANMALLARVRILQEAQDDGKTDLEEEEKKFSEFQQEVQKILFRVGHIMIEESKK